MDIRIIIPILSGLAAGLIINYLADVIPHTSRLSHPACENPECQQPFSLADYIFLRRCPKCGKKRGRREVVVYVLAIAAAVYLWLVASEKAGLSLEKLGFAFGLIVLTYLLAVAVIDLEHRLVLRPMSVAGLLLTAAAGYLMHGWLSTLIGGVTGFAIMFAFYLFGMLFTRLRARRLDQDPKGAEEALGSGDVTVATILGLLLGWPLIWFGLLLGLLFAGIASLTIVLVLVITRKYGRQALMVFIPIGPAFIASAILMIYLPNWIAALLPK